MKLSTAPKTVQAACQVLRRRVRYRDAGLRLQPAEFDRDDTAAIREATRVYTETWIVPLLDAIELNDRSALAHLIDAEKGDHIGEGSDA